MASKRRQRRQHCTGKVRHEDRCAAERHAASHSGTRAYQCGYCGGWHVGHPTGHFAATHKFNGRAGKF